MAMTSSQDDISKSIDEYLAELSSDSDINDMSESLLSISTTVSGGDSSYESDSFVVKSPYFDPNGEVPPSTPKYDEDDFVVNRADLANDPGDASDESLILVDEVPGTDNVEVLSVSLKSVIGADGLLHKKIRDSKRKRIFVDLTKDEEPGAARCRKAPRREVIVINDD